MKIFMRGIAAAALTGALVASTSLASAQAPPSAQSQAVDLPSLLHLKPNQLVAYQAMDAAGKESPAVMATMRAKLQGLVTATTPQRIDFQIEALNLQVARAHRVLEAERKFYAMLTPDQQHTFDQVTAPHPQAQR